MPPKTHMALSWSTAECRWRSGGGDSAPDPCDTKCHVSLPAKQKQKQGSEYLFSIAGVKKMKWFLSLTRRHF